MFTAPFLFFPLITLTAYVNMPWWVPYSALIFCIIPSYFLWKMDVAENLTIADQDRVDQTVPVWSKMMAWFMAVSILILAGMDYHRRSESADMQEKQAFFDSLEGIR